MFLGYIFPVIGKMGKGFEGVESLLVLSLGLSFGLCVGSIGGVVRDGLGGDLPSALGEEFVDAVEDILTFLDDVVEHIVGELRGLVCLLHLGQCLDELLIELCVQGFDDGPRYVEYQLVFDVDVLELGIVSSSLGPSDDTTDDGDDDGDYDRVDYLVDWNPSV